MDAATNELMKIGFTLDQYIARIIAINMIVTGPIIVAVSQIGLAIREMTINSRKEYNTDHSDYISLKWIAQIFFYIGWIMVPSGIFLLIKAL